MIKSLKRLSKPVLMVPGIRKTLNAARRFPGTEAYWESRYHAYGNSGAGSYGRLAEFKASVINTFVQEKQIISIIEFGCGDGNQLSLMSYPRYIGLDISRTALQKCCEKFRTDTSKSFYLYHPDLFVDNARLFQAELAVSLDVIFHIIEDNLYEDYMAHLFDSATTYVVIYSSNFNAPREYHIKRRRFSDWVQSNRMVWQLAETIENPYPFDERDSSNTSYSNFYIFHKMALEDDTKT